MKRKDALLLFLVMVMVSLTVALSACSGDKPGDETAKSLITVGIPQDIEDSLDPHKAVAAGTEEVLYNIFEGLYKPTPSGEFIPAIASGHTLAEDGLSYTFSLREGVKFHDHSLVTARDVKFSLDKCKGDDGAGPLVAAFANLREVEILDDKTVVLRLFEPDTEFLASLTAAIIPAANSSPETNPIGTGPYAYVSRSPQENIILTRFDDYWGEAAHIEQVVYKIIANADTIVMDLMGGGVDMFARVTASQAAELTTGFNILEGTMNLSQGLYLNNAVSPFDDERVRKALCYATDAQEIMALISDGKGAKIGSNMFPAFEKYYLAELSDVYTPNPAKARELLDEAGYPDGFAFTITVPSNYQQHIDTAQVLVEQYKAIGVEAKIELIPWDNWLADVFAGRNYEATVIALTASTLSARAMLDYFYSSSDLNFTNYNNPIYDAAFENAIGSADDAQKTAYYKDCQRILTDSAAAVFIQDLPEFVALRDNFGGYAFYPLYVQDMARIYVVE